MPRKGRRAQIKVPKGYQVRTLGKSDPPRLSEEEYMQKKITLRDQEGNVIAEGVTRAEALDIVKKRDKLRVAGLL